MKPRYVIAYKGLGEGSHGFEWKVGNDFWTGREESGIKGGDVTVEAVLEKGAKGAATPMRLAVEIGGNVVVPCDRCLEDCELPINFRGSLALKFSAGGEDGDAEFLNERSEGDIMWLNPGETTIDLEQYIYESIVLSLPLQRIHPEDVHGTPLCNPAMLERFRIVSEEEFENLTTK